MDLTKFGRGAEKINGSYQISERHQEDELILQNWRRYGEIDTGKGESGKARWGY